MTTTQGRGAHTGGPWRWRLDGTNHDILTCSKPAEAASSYVAHAYGETFERREANARLIATAPELLEALKLAKSLIELGSIVPGLSCETRLRDFEDIATAAIAKAESHT